MTVKGAATLTANILSGRPHYVQLLIVGIDDSGPSVYSIDSAGGSIPMFIVQQGQAAPSCTEFLRISMKIPCPRMVP